MTVKVLLVEDLALSRSGFHALLENSGEVKIVGEAIASDKPVWPKLKSQASY